MRQTSSALLGWSLTVLLGSAHAAPPGADGNTLYYELSQRITQMERELRQLRGDIEEAIYRQESDLRQMEERLSRLEGHAPVRPQGTPPIVPPITDPYPQRPAPTAAPGAASSGWGAPVPTLAPPPAYANAPATAAVASPAEEQAAYDAAFGMLRDGRYTQAVQAFQSYLGRYPNAALAGNAHYWLAEAHYVTRDFPKARDSLLEYGSRFPNHDRMPDALLRLGTVYQELRDSNRAREVWQQLIKVYPGTPAASEAQKRLQGGKTG